MITLSDIKIQYKLPCLFNALLIYPPPSKFIWKCENGLITNQCKLHNSIKIQHILKNSRVIHAVVNSSTITVTAVKNCRDIHVQHPDKS